MKQKSLRLLVPIALASLIICACQGNKAPTPTPTSSEPAVTTYTITFVNDDGTVLQEGPVEEGVMPEYTGATPTKAATAQYTYTFDTWVPALAVATADATYTASYSSTVNRYTVTFDSVGGTTIAPVTVEYGQTVAKPSDPVRPREGDHFYDFTHWALNGQEFDFTTPITQDITLVAQYQVTNYVAPVIEIAGSQTTFSVNAGESLNLPEVTAHDYKNRPLEVEFEDEFGGSSIKNGVFTSKVAGEHVITFYAEDEFDELGTNSITVTVVPAAAESFAVAANENVPANITSYGTYKENFQKGVNSPYYKSLVDGTKSAYISATSEAISGNSLVFNAKTIIGSANALFGKVINDVVRRETQVTYTIEFDYKAINEGGSFNGLYFSPSYDTAAGAMGKDTKLNAQVGVVSHFSETYSRFVFPGEPTNCYLRIFNHNPSNTSVDSYVAIDNIVVTAKEETQITYVSPTTEQLTAEEGFTWNMADKTAEISNTAIVAVNELSDPLKSAMAASEYFGSDVIQIKGSSDHQMKSLNGNNVIAGKILEVTFWFYSVKDLGAIIYMGCNGGNPTITGDNISTTVIEGNIKKTTAKLLLNSYAGVDVVNFYGTSANDEIYVGKINAKIYDYVPPQEVIDKPTATIPTTAQLEAGYTWNMVDNFIDFDNSEYIDVSAMEDATAKAAIQGYSDFGANVLRFKGGKMLLGVGKNNLTAGKIFNLTIDYYNVSDAFQYLIVFGDGNSNFTQPSNAYTKEVITGNFKRFSFSVLLTADMLQLDTLLTTYNGNCEMLIGKVTVSAEEPEETFVDYTPTTAELEAGFTWEIGSANHHLGFSSCNEVVKVEKISDATIKGELSGKGTYVDHVTLGGGANAIINGLGGANVPDGKKFTIVIEYYEVAAVQYFLLGGSGVGATVETISGHLKRATYSYEPTSSFNYFSLYNSGEVYVYSVYVKLDAYVAPQNQTPNGHTVGEQITVYQAGGSWVSTNKNGYVVTDYDGGIDNLASLEGMGSAPKKIEITNPSGLIEISQGHSTELEIGVTYKLIVYFYNVDYDGNMYIYGDNNQFWQVPGFESQTGYHKFEYNVTPSATCNWLCIYSSTNTKSGTIYMGSVIAEVVSLAS